jgi:hypothetical protein
MHFSIHAPVIINTFLRVAKMVGYYSNPNIQKTAAWLGVKILPKQLASVFPFMV